MGFFSKKEPEQPNPKKSAKKLKKVTKKLDKKQQKKLKRHEWARLKEEAKEDNVSLYYSCGVHNVNAYTPWGHEEICDG